MPIAMREEEGDTRDILTIKFAQDFSNIAVTSKAFTTDISTR